MTAFSIALAVVLLLDSVMPRRSHSCTQFIGMFLKYSGAVFTLLTGKHYRLFTSYDYYDYYKHIVKSVHYIMPLSVYNSYTLLRVLLMYTHMLIKQLQFGNIFNLYYMIMNIYLKFNLSFI